MKNNFFLIFLTLTLFSCTKNKKDLEIELLTNKVICVDNLERFDFIETRYEPNKDYDSLSKNILQYRITNNSDKKYFIMFNENSIGTLERDLYREGIGKKNFSPLNSLDFSLYKNDSVLDGSSTRAEMLSCTSSIFETKQTDSLIDNFLKKNKLNKTYALEQIDFPDGSLQGFVLHPEETKYFTSILNLPYRDNQKWISNIDKRKPNQGSISLKNDSTFTKSILTENQKKEIKENGYVLFDGKIYSNRVPVKLISLKDNTKESKRE
ncbi:hypothetical protein IUY40_15210 [Flavobacterium sp. ALJ2]|uniref:hypothetical protein n=1 Tax=Flavobacterium sp. ALJ2 TaxID=2786960 RepID=UPI00189E7994|nr:hypothetical protein [Flavobacterium sp. ALJ2]MBF7092883.1 hypothetical protein [Flavobacterium sp. ALJ2]